MTKSTVIRQLSRMVEAHVGKTSEVLREFKKCPQFRQCCQILARAVQDDSYGRKRSVMKPPPGLVPPG